MIHIHVKLRNQTNNRHSRGFENWTAENDWLLLETRWEEIVKETG